MIRNLTHKLRINFRGPIWLITSGAVAVGLVLAIVLVALRPRMPIPESILQKLNFSVFYPGGHSTYKVDQNSITYSSSDKVLIFHAKSDDNDLTISEQATPDSFNDIPDYYTKLLEKLNDYKDFDSVSGKVALTRPQELKGAQSAVFNSRGVLMFVHPAHDLSNDDWRKFFDSIEQATTN